MCTCSDLDQNTFSNGAFSSNIFHIFSQLVNKFLAPLSGTDLVLGGSVENLGDLQFFGLFIKISQHMGSIRLRNHDRSIRVLTDVWYVPMLKKNLISLRALESKGLVLMI